MTHSANAVEDGGVVSRNRVIETLRPILRTAIIVNHRFSVDELLAIIGYGGAKALDDADEPKPMQDVARVMGSFNTFVQAAADDRIDHTERASVRDATDAIIATLSHGDAA